MLNPVKFPEVIPLEVPSQVKVSPTDQGLKLPDQLEGSRTPGDRHDVKVRNAARWLRILGWLRILHDFCFMFSIFDSAHPILYQLIVAVPLSILCLRKKFK